MPKVSVVIPTYNRASLLHEAVASVLQQSMSDLEVIVVDDGSTDETQAILNSLKSDPRVRSILQSNAGRSTARNHGASVASGEFIGFLDSDDRYLGDCLESHLKVLNEFPATGLTVGGYDLIDESGTGIGARLPWLECEDLSLSDWLFNCLAMPGSVLFRRQWFERVAGFDSRCEIAEDWDVFLRLAVQGCQMHWVRSSVCQYRQHSGNSFRTLTRHHQGSEQAFQKLSQQAETHPILKENLPRAIVYLHLLFARRALSQKELSLARGFMQQALQTGPEPTSRQKVDMAEFVLNGDVSSAESTLSTDMLELVQNEITISKADFRKAQARVFMKRYFAAQQSDQKRESIGYLRSALSLDWSWLGNRGVLANVVRYYLGLV